jgi:hypothetical protein
LKERNTEIYKKQAEERRVNIKRERKDNVVGTDKRRNKRSERR